MIGLLDRFALDFWMLRIGLVDCRIRPIFRWSDFQIDFRNKVDFTLVKTTSWKMDRSLIRNSEIGNLSCCQHFRIISSN
jgi:hypothetical protein